MKFILLQWCSYTKDHLFESTLVLTYFWVGQPDTAGPELTHIYWPFNTNKCKNITLTSNSGLLI